MCVSSRIRLLVVTSGIGLFHYLPDAGESRELRSVVVGAGDAVLFTRGVVHTFTAPLDDLTLLSYHVPFFELEDARQYLIFERRTGGWVWQLSSLLQATQRFVGSRFCGTAGFERD